MLTRSQCEHCRHIARDAFLEAHGERRRAIQIARRNFTIPPDRYVPGELGFAGLTESDIEVLPADDDGGEA